MLCGPEHGTAGVSSESDNDVGFDELDYFARLHQAFGQTERHREVLEREASLYAEYRQPYDAVPECWYLLHLHFTFGSHEEEFDIIAVTALQCFGDSDSGVDMSTRSAARPVLSVS